MGLCHINIFVTRKCIKSIAGTRIKNKKMRRNDNVKRREREKKTDSTIITVTIRVKDMNFLSFAQAVQEQCT